MKHLSFFSPLEPSRIWKLSVNILIFITICLSLVRTQYCVIQWFSCSLLLKKRKKEFRVLSKTLSTNTIYNNLEDFNDRTAVNSLWIKIRVYSWKSRPLIHVSTSFIQQIKKVQICWTRTSIKDIIRGLSHSTIWIR